MRRLPMQTQSNEKRCNNYVAADYEKKLAMLTRKLEDAEMQGAKETKMRRHYEHLVNDTKSDVECKQFASLTSQVDRMMAKMDADEKELEEAKQKEFASWRGQGATRGASSSGKKEA